MYDLIVEGYRFCRSDGEPFDSSVTTFVPPKPHLSRNAPNVVVPFQQATDETDLYDSDGDGTDLYHQCDFRENTEPNTVVGPAPFVLAHRCEPIWSTLSDQQRDFVETVEKEVDAYRKDGKFFRSVIVEGLGGCGKTRLMAYVMNHSPENTHVLYVTKQNKRLQDFLYNELDKGEPVRPRPVMDMSKCCYSDDFWMVSRSVGGRYACSVEKLVYNICGRDEARETNTRKALQWKMNIPDTLFAADRIKNGDRNVVVLLDEYTMISPPLLHKMLHCVELLFSAPTVLIMGGDRFQLGPINWDECSDKNYADKCGEVAPVGAATTDNCYYVSDVRGELNKRMRQEPFEYQMVGSQRCRDDPRLAKMVVYLRTACQNDTSVKAVERRMVAFGRSRAIRLYRCAKFGQACKAGRLVFDPSSITSPHETKEDPTDEDACAAEIESEDRHLGDGDGRDTIAVQTDWTDPPIVDMAPFIKFYTDMYEEIFDAHTRTEGEDTLLKYVYAKSSAFAENSYPVFMVKKNNKCNILSDTFLKTLYNGVHMELRKRYQKPLQGDHADEECEPKRMKMSPTVRQRDAEFSSIERFLNRLCVSIPVTDNSPVQQTLVVGVPYRMTETLKSTSTNTPVVSNGELVLLTGIRFNDRDGSLDGVYLKTLQRQTDHFLFVSPGMTQNRLYTATDDFQRQRAYMLPLVPMVCENIYQMQGNTIVSDCFVDLLSTKINDIYVAVSRFKRTSSIKGIILSE